MHHQLQYLNIFAESNYLKRGNCLPCTAAHANSSLSKNGAKYEYEYFPAHLEVCVAGRTKYLHTKLKIQRCKERQFDVLRESWNG